MKNFSAALVLASTLCLVCSSVSFAGANRDSRMPRLAPDGARGGASYNPMEPKNVPDFAQGGPAESSSDATAGSPASTLLRSDLESATLPVQTRFKLVIEYPVDAKTSVPGDIFEAHVKDDLFLGRNLILPRGSLVRGRVAEITKPRLISRAAKIGLKLDQIVTPTGDVIPLDAALEFQKGMTNKAGQLDPGTNLGTRVEKSVRTVTGLDEKGAAKGALIAANVATLGAPAIATAIGSGAIALFKTGDNVSLQPGQELEILLTNDLGLQLN
jgi:hypothetical protein